MSTIGVGQPLGSSLDLSAPTQLVLGRLDGETVHDETALHVVQRTKVLASLLNLDNILETSLELVISPGLAINLDKPLL